MTDEDLRKSLEKTGRASPDRKPSYVRLVVGIGILVLIATIYNAVGEGRVALNFLVWIVALYFIPLIVAVARHHRQRLAIGMLNVFAGWSLIGWIAALVWACTSDTER